MSAAAAAVAVAAVAAAAAAAAVSPPLAFVVAAVSTKAMCQAYIAHTEHRRAHTPTISGPDLARNAAISTADAAYHSTETRLRYAISLLFQFPTSGCIVPAVAVAICWHSGRLQPDHHSTASALTRLLCWAL